MTAKKYTVHTYAAIAYLFITMYKMHTHKYLHKMPYVVYFAFPSKTQQLDAFAIYIRGVFIN